MRASFIVLPLLLGACEDRGAEPTPSPTPNVVRAPITGETSTRVAIGKGAVAELRSGTAVPVVLPPGFTIYPGANIVRNSVVVHDGQRSALVEFETPDPVAKVLRFHRAQAHAAGATLTLDVAGSVAASIGGSTAGGEEFAMTARRAPGRTAVQLSFTDPVDRDAS